MKIKIQEPRALPFTGAFCWLKVAEPGISVSGPDSAGTAPGAPKHPTARLQLLNSDELSAEGLAFRNSQVTPQCRVTTLLKQEQTHM